eukprot:gene9737-11539_t
MASLRVVNCPNQDLALTNHVFCSPADERSLVPYAEFAGSVYFVRPHPTVEAGCIALNGAQRKGARVSSGETLMVTPFRPPTSKFSILMANLEIDFIAKGRGKAETVDAKLLAKELNKRLSSQVFTVGQKATFEFQGTNYMFDVSSVVIEGQKETEVLRRGMLLPTSQLQFETPANSGIKGLGGTGQRAESCENGTLRTLVHEHSVLSPGNERIRGGTGRCAEARGDWAISNQHSAAKNNLFKEKDFNFEKLGI